MIRLGSPFFLFALAVAFGGGLLLSAWQGLPGAEHVTAPAPTFYAAEVSAGYQNISGEFRPSMVGGFTVEVGTIGRVDQR